MVKAVKFASVCLIIVIITVCIFSFSDKYKVGVIKNNIECTIISKCNEDARAIEVIDDNMYVAYPNSVKIISDDGKVKKLFEITEEIDDVTYLLGKIYVICKNNIYEYNLESGKVDVFLSDIPSGSRDIKHRIIAYNDRLLFTIPSETNSGIYKDNTIEEIATFGDERIRSASIYSINNETKEVKLFSTGIRGIKGMGVSSKGKIYAIFSGMNNKGIRPIENDADYIYEVKEKLSYGWPNYSGGDPINSPRFAKEKLVEFLGEYKPLEIYKPILVSNTLGELDELGVYMWDKILPKDSIIYVDKDDNKIEAIVDEKYRISLLKLIDTSDIRDIEVNEDKIIILDSGAKAIYCINAKSDSLKFNLSITILIYLFILGVSIIIVVILKKRKKKEKENE